MSVDNYITGSSGFIGSHLLKRLEGQKNLCIENDLIWTLFDETRAQPHNRFFFLSAYGNLAHQHEWGMMVDANLLDLIQILYCNEGRFKTFVYTSSSSVNLPVQTAYSHQKTAGEHILLSCPEPIKPIIIRPYSVTGIGEQKEHLIPKLIHSCFTGEEMPFAPDATHDWIDVEDVVDGMLLLSEKAERGVYELGNGFPVKNLTVRKWVEDITGKEANCVPWAGRSYDSDSWYSKDVSALRLGWHPKRTLNQSIEGMVEDYLKNEPAKTQVC